MTIAHRKCIDILRASVRRPVPVQQTPDVPSSLGVPDEGQVELLDAVGQLRTASKLSGLRSAGLHPPFYCRLL